MKKLMIIAVLMSGMLISAEGFAQNARVNKGNHKVEVNNKKDKGGYKTDHKDDKKGGRNDYAMHDKKHKDNYNKNNHHKNHDAHKHHHQPVVVHRPQVVHRPPVVVHRPEVHVVHHDNDIIDAVVTTVSIIGLVTLLAN